MEFPMHWLIILVVVLILLAAARFPTDARLGEGVRVSKKACRQSNQGNPPAQSVSTEKPSEDKPQT